MADYKELLRRAIETLPENNGAARRAVYEKARSALVGQLRAIDPPLPAREITQHRLQLEDSIRQVEQEASEAVIAGLKQQEKAPVPAPVVTPPQPEPVIEPAPQPVETYEEEAVEAAAAPEEVQEPAPVPEAADAVEETETSEVEVLEPEMEMDDESSATIEAIIAAEDAAAHQTEEEESEPVPAAVKPEEPFAPANDDKQPLLGSVTSLVARAEATKSAPSSPLTFRSPKPFASPVSPIKGPTFEPRRDGGNVVAAQRIEPAVQIQAIARQVAEPLAVVDQPASVALSSVREVEVEPASDPQKAIDRAIETLDREARGESTDSHPSTVVEVNRPAPQLDPFSRPDPVREAEVVAKAAEDGFNDDDMPRRGGGSAVTIFLLVFVLLLAGAGGAGYWAWREGYVDPATMFGQGTPAMTDTATNTVPTPSTPTLSETVPAPSANNTAETPANNTAATDVAEAQPPAVDNKDSAPGNTAPSENAVEPTQELKTDDRLLPENDVITAETNQPTSPDNAGKDDERLPNGNAATPTPSTGDTALDAAALAGSQSLLLEASDDGTTGAVPFTGTVEWSEGKDETGLPTLIGKANIPARNLGVDVLIRKNSDPSLPASHLMEINFNVSETFMGGAIAGLPGVLLKNEELVQGTPLVGASARVVGNSFLFALSSSPDDATTNDNLLTSRKWMDLALIYATGKRAIITLEKDDKATALFDKVFGEWAKATPPAATPAASQG